jgi:hypothetical protein
VVELAGIPGLIGAAVGAAIGGYLAQQQRQREHRP